MDLRNGELHRGTAHDTGYNIGADEPAITALMTLAEPLRSRSTDPLLLGCEGHAEFIAYRTPSQH